MFIPLVGRAGILLRRLLKVYFVGIPLSHCHWAAYSTKMHGQLFKLQMIGRDYSYHHAAGKLLNSGSHNIVASSTLTHCCLFGKHRQKCANHPYPFLRLARFGLAFFVPLINALFSIFRSISRPNTVSCTTEYWKLSDFRCAGYCCPAGGWWWLSLGNTSRQSKLLITQNWLLILDSHTSLTLVILC